MSTDRSRCEAAAQKRTDVNAPFQRAESQSDRIDDEVRWKALTERTDSVILPKIEAGSNLPTLRTKAHRRKSAAGISRKDEAQELDV